MAGKLPPIKPKPKVKVKAREALKGVTLGPEKGAAILRAPGERAPTLAASQRPYPREKYTPKSRDLILDWIDELDTPARQGGVVGDIADRYGMTTASATVIATRLRKNLAADRDAGLLGRAADDLNITPDQLNRFIDGKMAGRPRSGFPERAAELFGQGVAPAAIGERLGKTKNHVEVALGQRRKAVKQFLTEGGTSAEQIASETGMSAQAVRALAKSGKKGPFPPADFAAPLALGAGATGYSLFGASDEAEAVPLLKPSRVALGQLTNEAAPSGRILAYHGSPHTFDRFDFSKMGTGEGAQAYGHGLYFAESPGVAKAYQQNLGAKSVDGRDDFGAAQQMANDRFNALSRMSTPEKQRLRAIEDLRFERSYAARDPRNAEILPRYDMALKLLEDEGYKPLGRLYEVDLPEGPYLDWDKPLYRQPDDVQEVFGWTPELRKEYDATERLVDDGLIGALTGKISDFDINQASKRSHELNRMVGVRRDATGAEIIKGNSVFDRPADKFRTEELGERGLKGTRYLDQGSRSAGEGSSNYVIFNDKDVNLRKMLGLGVGATGGAGASLFGAEDAEAAPFKPRIAGPKTAYHGSDAPWIVKGDSPDLSLGEGFGLHAGSKEQAKARLDVPGMVTTRDGVRIGQRPALGVKGEWVDKVTLGKGREIEVPDLDTWDPSKWEGALTRGDVKGLSPEEADAVLARMSEAYSKPPGQHDARLAREALRDVGVQRVRYRNQYEQPGQYSYVALDPDIIQPHDWKKRAGDLVTTGASLGGAAAVLSPQDAEGETLAAGNGPSGQRVRSNVRLGSPPPRGAGEGAVDPFEGLKPAMLGGSARYAETPLEQPERSEEMYAAPTRSESLWAPVGHALMALNPYASPDERKYRLDATGRSAQNWLNSRKQDTAKLGGDILEGVATTAAPFASAPFVMAADNYDQNKASPTLGAENLEPFIEQERQAQMSAKADADKWAGVFRGLGVGPPPPKARPSEGPMIARGGGEFDLLGSAYAAPAGAKTPVDESRARIADMEEVNRKLSTGSVAEKQQFLIEQGYNVRPDGRMGPETEAYLEQVRARNDAALAKEREVLQALVEQEAFATTRPSGATETLREWGPMAAFGGGVALAEFAPKGLGRLSAVSNVEKKALGRNARVDALLNLDPVQIPTGKRIGLGRRQAANQEAVRRSENINEFWRQGGAGENVPFKAARTEQGFTTRTAKDVADASTLFPAGPSLYRGTDLGYAALGGIEAAAMQPFVEDAKRELAAAQAALDAERSEANYRRLEDAKNSFAQAEALQRTGQGFAAGRMVMPFAHRYPDIKPNIPAAAGERGELNQFLKSAQPSSKPKRRPKRTTK